MTGGMNLMDRFEIILGKKMDAYNQFIESLYELRLGEHTVSENWNYLNLPSKETWNTPQSMFTIVSAPNGVSFLF